MGYKAGMEIPLLESYYHKLEKEGVVERTSKSLDHWYVKPNKSEEYEEE